MEIKYRFYVTTTYSRCFSAAHMNIFYITEVTEAIHCQRLQHFGVSLGYSIWEVTEKLLASGKTIQKMGDKMSAGLTCDPGKFCDLLWLALF